MFENKVFPHRTVNMRKREINCYDVFCAKLLADSKDQFGLWVMYNLLSVCSVQGHANNICQGPMSKFPVSNKTRDKVIDTR